LTDLSAQQKVSNSSLDSGSHTQSKVPGAKASALATNIPPATQLPSAQMRVHEENYE